MVASTVTSTIAILPSIANRPGLFTNVAESNPISRGALPSHNAPAPIVLPDQSAMGEDEDHTTLTSSHSRRVKRSASPSASEAAIPKTRRGSAGVAHGCLHLP